MLVATTVLVVSLTAQPVRLTYGGALVATAVVGLTLVGAELLWQRTQGPLQARSVLLRVVGVVFLMGPLLSTATVGRLPLNRLVRARTPPGAVAQDPARARENTFADTLDRIFLVALVLAVAALLIWGVEWRVLLHRLRVRWVTWRRPDTALGRGGAPVTSEAEARVAALRRALDVASWHVDDPDAARRAVIEAYVALEDHLAAHGFPRKHSDTPREYVERVLATGFPAERQRIQDLLDVFGAARFSELAITVDDARRAREHIAALVSR